MSSYSISTQDQRVPLGSSIVPTLYRSVLEGQGGTLWYREPNVEDARTGFKDEDLLPYMGTRGCITCVGVYFKIDKLRAFIAHIDAYIRDELTIRQDTVNEAEGTQLRLDVTATLALHSLKHNWNPRTVDPGSIILVCPTPQARPYGSLDPTGEKKTGWWVVDGIREFLSLQQDTMILTQDQGFVLNHDNGSRLMVPYPAGGCVSQHVKPAELRECTETVVEGLEKWEFGIDAKQGTLVSGEA
ncbi:hypothetical protein LTR36_009963 [Oleoguttula mirabilis]|uniref:Uncharacterized protein n=1 Tax=Oleoguttula mirabilis TaxID=1507867 RepID=A0AAV9J4M7_9PEZI|nr:hypothetical protein LTR36_009963 [Oleoguttula mirabilis]